tara:strand:+ start:70 stop:693 length:624 start_codon:yes stop_codon:yes gene_type:complete
MDWIRILEVLVTSVSSIIVALVGAGFFRQMRDKQEKSRSKEKLMEQIKKDEIVHLAIRDVRRSYNADRVYIWQFHNGGSFYTTSPMQKLSITYERCSDGLERKAEKNQNHLITSFTSYIKDTMDGKMYFPNVEDMNDIGLRSLAYSSGTKGHCAVPIYDKDKHLVAILCLDWVFSEIPKQYLKKDGQFTQDFIDEFSTDADTLDPYL